jgi:hypothetical protein
MRSEETTKGPFNHDNLKRQIRFTRCCTTHTWPLDRIQNIFLRLWHSPSAPHIISRRARTQNIIYYSIISLLHPVLIIRVSRGQSLPVIMRRLGCDIGWVESVFRSRWRNVFKSQWHQNIYLLMTIAIDEFDR